jgi:uncharacterized protein YqeY
MSMKDRLAEETKDALRSGQKLRLSTLRLLSAAVKNREVEVRHPLDDDEFVEIAGQEAKRRRDAIDAYEKAGREDRAATEREELGILQAYLPAALTDQEIDALVDQAIADTGAAGPGDMGKVMGAVMAKTRGRADGRAVQARVRDRLR